MSEPLITSIADDPDRRCTFLTQMKMINFVPLDLNKIKSLGSSEACR